MSTQRIEMVYVAADPKQPGSAFAMCDDDPRYAKDTAAYVSDWIKRGAIVQHTTRDSGLEMLRKWVRPAKPQQEMPL